jgi:transcriptional regulator with XRE-family HTH domain
VDEVTIGARLRTLRRWRGIGQKELADLSGVSQSFISMVENGQRMLDRRSQIAALATALRVSESDLVGGPHLSADRVQSDPHMAIPPLRVALQTSSLTEPSVEQGRPLAQLRELVFGRAEPLLRVGDFVGVGKILPDCIDELYFHAASPADEAGQQLALETLVDTCVIASSVSKLLGYSDLANLAAERAREAAAMLGDPVQRGKAAYAWLMTLPRAGSWDRNLAAAERAASALEPHARDPLGRQVLGMLTLTASLAAASTQRPERAAHWLGEAAAIGSQVADTPVANWRAFSTTNVNIWSVSIGVEQGETGSKVLEQAARVNLDLLEPKAARRSAFMLDVGQGLAREPRTRAEAVRWLRRAEEAAPQRFRNSTSARETVAYLLNRATAAAGGRELRGMAARMGVPH